MPQLSGSWWRTTLASHHVRSRIGWALFVVAALVAVVDLDSSQSNPLVHPEALYPATLYQDLANWANWSTPFSPYFFPDLPLAFVAMAVTGDPVVSLYVFAVLQVLLLVVGWCWLARRLFEEGEGRQLAQRLTVLVGAFLMLGLGTELEGGKLLVPLFMVAFHTGVFVLAVFGHAMLLTALDESRWAARWMVGLLVITCLGVLSDKLMLVLFVGPALAVLVFRWREPQGRRWKVGAVIVAGTLLGHVAIAGINATGTLHVPSLTPTSPWQVVENLAALPSQVEAPLAFVVDRFFESAPALYRVLWFLWLGLTAVLIFVGRGLRSFAVFTVVSCLATILATVYIAVGQYGVQTGVYGILFIHRYLTSVFVVPFLCLALYVPGWMARRRRAAVETVLVVFLVVFCLFRAVGLEMGSSFPAYRHAGVDCLDEAAAERGATTGLAFSFQAPVINALSRHGLHADQVTLDFEPITWIDSRIRWDADGYDFVIANALRREATESLAELALSEESCDGWQVFFFDPPLTGASGRR